MEGELKRADKNLVSQRTAAAFVGERGGAQGQSIRAIQRTRRQASCGPVAIRASPPFPVPPPPLSLLIGRWPLSHLTNLMCSKVWLARQTGRRAA